MPESRATTGGRHEVKSATHCGIARMGTGTVFVAAVTSRSAAARPGVQLSRPVCSWFRCVSSCGVLRHSAHIGLLPR